MTSIRFAPRPNNAHQICWHEWGEDAFQQAQAEDKPVLLSISAVWCHWCHVMDETSYSDTEAISLINQHFIAVRVDQDQRPDINARYNMGGWPTTAFLTPHGDVISGATYLAPQQFKESLVQVSEAYSQRKEGLLQLGQELQHRRRVKVARAWAGQKVDSAIVDTVSEVLAEAYDPRYGGFGSQPKFPMVSAVEFLLHTYQSTGDSDSLLMAEKTLDGMMKGGLQDHQEGGFFRYVTTEDWSVPHYEKMLEDNVGLLRLYLRSHLITGKDGYAGVASRIVDYLNSHLFDDVSGAFYGSEDADEAYYALPLSHRRERRPPGADLVHYSSLNSLVVSAYLEANWVLGRPDLRAVALRLLDYLLGKCQERRLRHCYFPDGSTGVLAFLADYACLTIALLDAYGWTFEQRYLDEAERLTREMAQDFEDVQGGGFFDIPEDLQAQGNLKVREKPLSGNVVAIEALTKLFHFTSNQTYCELASRALSAFVPVYQEYGEAAAGYALAVRRFLSPPVDVKVVGEPGGAGTKALLRAAATIPYPHTTLEFIDSTNKELLEAAGYWPSEVTQAYVCLETLCLAPISDPQALHHAVVELLKSPFQEIESII